MGALQADAPERLPQQLVALPAMELVQEVFEITRWWLLVAFQPKQLCNLVVVTLSISAAPRKPGFS